MTAEQRRRAFDRFWRAPDAPKGGTGLGLSLVQRLAHVSGGEATLAAAPGGGLDAFVRLRPVSRAGAARPVRIALGRRPPGAPGPGQQGSPDAASDAEPPVRGSARAVSSGSS
ncbi:sensor histidine kinase [Streptomyces cucumeris]|uniref:sensor histidine kinase n=1 Tax=Streptomyces cucumeris TaxID=2962890 RepID=UPI003D711A2E